MSKAYRMKSTGKTERQKIGPKFLDTLFNCTSQPGTAVVTHSDSSHLAIVPDGSIEHDPPQKVHHGHWAEMDGHESPLVYFVTPLFSFLRKVFLTHSRYQFDTTGDHLFHRRSGSGPRKIICVLLQICLLMNLWSENKLIESRLGSKNIVGLFKILGTAYLALMIAFFYGLMCKGDEIRDILNFMQNMTVSICIAGCQVPRKKNVKTVSLSILGLYIVYTILFSVVNVDGTHGASLGHGVTSFLISCADQAARKLMVLSPVSKNISEIQAYKFSANSSTTSNSSLFLVAGMVQLMVHVMTTLCWTMAFLMITMWGLLFWKVLFGFFNLIKRSSGRNTLEDIRKFNTITGVIDKFNKAFGWTILAGVSVGVLHFSVSIIDLFQDSKPLAERTVIAIGLAAFGILLLTSAQVNNEAANIIEVIKDRYQDESVWKDFHGDCTETTQGMQLIFHEIQSNRIGFSGRGFFTLTYSFIGTVLSLISSYSVVVMQFQN